MKKFYQHASAGPTDDGFGIFLDGKRMQTPAKTPLTLPNQALASAIAEEWAGQGETIEPATMPLTQLASTAQDRMGADPHPGQESERSKILRALNEYAATDLLCYRSDSSGLAKHQAAGWQPWLNWIAEAHGVRLDVTDDVMPIQQPQVSLDRVAELLDAMDAWQLSGAMVLIPALGSFVLGYAVYDGALDVETAAALAMLDETYQFETWGEDAEAVQTLANKTRDILGAAKFLELLG